MKALLIIFFLIFSTQLVISQVGVGTNTVHESAMFEVESETKGVLVTRVSSRFAVENNCSVVAEGLLIYDESESSFYTWTEGQWHKVNPWKTTESGNIQNNEKVGIGVNPDASMEKLQVNGSVKTSGSITVENTGTINGYGTIPIGGIIMWSGSGAPEGWALCNGQISNGITTPDLRGRFVVGYDPANSNYLQPGNLSLGGTTIAQTGGNISVSLAKSQIPTHTHDKGTFIITGLGQHTHTYQYEFTKVDHNTDKDKPVLMKIGAGGASQTTITYTGGSHSHYVEGLSGNGASDGLSGQAHENRPPYYVLAYIIRVK